MQLRKRSKFEEEAVDFARELYKQSTRDCLGVQEEKEIVLENDERTYILSIDVFWEKACWGTYKVYIMQDGKAEIIIPDTDFEF